MTPRQTVELWVDRFNTKHAVAVAESRGCYQPSGDAGRCMNGAIRQGYGFFTAHNERIAF